MMEGVKKMMGLAFAFIYARNFLSSDGRFSHQLINLVAEHKKELEKEEAFRKKYNVGMTD